MFYTPLLYAFVLVKFEMKTQPLEDSPEVLTSVENVNVGWVFLTVSINFTQLLNIL